MHRAPLPFTALPACAGLVGILGAMCSPLTGPSADVLDHAYVGQLDLLYTQEFPAISASARMDVEVGRDGRMTFRPGVLSYDGEATEGDSRLRRSGTVNLAPTGAWVADEGQGRLSVVENGTGSDRIQQWGFDGVVWHLMLDQTTPVAWNGGLSFELADAVLNGSVVSVNAGFYSVRWTLYLTPTLVN